MNNLSIIVAIGQNNEIGKDNDLLWYISDDLKRFKKITTGNTIVMGYNTFKSLPKGALPNRRNMVLSFDDVKLENAEVFLNIDDLLKALDKDEKVFIIGGGSLYHQFIDKVDRMYLTKVDASFEADVFFPDFDWNNWEIEEEQKVPKGEKNEYSHSFFALKRKL
jgi:dihydrofolate reductase